jgi:hypothetical protein
MSKVTISFSDPELEGRSFEFDTEEHLSDTQSLLLQLYFNISKMNYLTTYIGRDPFEDYNKVVSEAAEVAREAFKQCVLKSEGEVDHE